MGSYVYFWQCSSGTGQTILKRFKVSTSEWETVHTAPKDYAAFGSLYGTVNRAVQIGKYIYFVGNAQTAYKMIKFDIEKNTYTELHDTPFGATKHMIAWDGGNYIYTIHGSAYKYNITLDYFTQIATPEEYDYNYSSLVRYNNNIVCVGCWSWSGGDHIRIKKYNPDTNSWTLYAANGSYNGNVLECRESACVIGGSIYFVESRQYRMCECTPSDNPNDPAIVIVSPPNPPYGPQSAVTDSSRYMYSFAHWNDSFRYDAFLNSYIHPLSNAGSCDFGVVCYVTLRNFVFYKSDGITETDLIEDLGATLSGVSTEPKKYYIKSRYGTQGNVLLKVVEDPQNDADNWTYVSTSSTGPWYPMVGLGVFSAGEEKPFWIKSVPPIDSSPGTRKILVQVSG